MFILLYHLSLFYVYFFSIAPRRKGITIIVDSPFEKGKFYLTKERFINKIYECCIYKGYVSYDDIMNEDIG